MDQQRLAVLGDPAREPDAERGPEELEVDLARRRRRGPRRRSGRGRPGLEDVHPGVVVVDDPARLLDDGPPDGLGPSARLRRADAAWRTSSWRAKRAGDRLGRPWAAGSSRRRGADGVAGAAARARPTRGPPARGGTRAADRRVRWADARSWSPRVPCAAPATQRLRGTGRAGRTYRSLGSRGAPPAATAAGSGRGGPAPVGGLGGIVGRVRPARSGRRPVAADRRVALGAPRRDAARDPRDVGEARRTGGSRLRRSLAARRRRSSRWAGRRAARRGGPAVSRR